MMNLKSTLHKDEVDRIPVDDQNPTETVFTRNDSGSEAAPLVTGPARPAMTPEDQEANDHRDDLAYDT